MRKSKKKRGLSNMQIFTSCISTTLVLILLGIVVFFVQVAHKLSDTVKEDLTVSVLLNEDSKSEKIENFAKDLQQKTYISHIKYISKEQALAEYIEEIGSNPEEFLGANPFSPSLELHLRADYANSDSLEWITCYLESSEMVLDVIYQKDLIDSLNNNLKKAGLILLTIALLLMLVSFGLINSMVKMSLYSNRFLIHTMKLVGARWSFIRKPFLTRSFWIGFVSALFANLILIGGIQILLRYDLELQDLITKNMMLISSLCVLITGILLTGTCSYFSVNRFLKMKAGELHEL